MEEVMMGLTRALDGRVYVAVGRGLWDFTAKEVYDYVEGLQEGRENKVGSLIIVVRAVSHVVQVVGLSCERSKSWPHLHVNTLAFGRYLRYTVVRPGRNQVFLLNIN